MIREQDKLAFWAVVRDCLIEIYGLTRSEALSRSKKLRETVEETPERRHGSVFYHADPLEVASDLAGKEVDLSKVQDRYETILARHNW